MRIKKMYQSGLPAGSVLNTDSNSQTSTFSCNYINDNFFNNITKPLKFNHASNSVTLGATSTWIPTSLSDRGATKCFAITEENGEDYGMAKLSGQMHVYTDGKFWQNEGAYPCLDTSSVSLLWSDYNSSYQEDVNLDSSYLTNWDFLLIMADHATQIVSTSWITGGLIYCDWNGSADRVFTRAINYNADTQGIKIIKCFERGLNGTTGAGYNGYYLIVRQVWGIKIWK